MKKEPISEQFRFWLCWVGGKGERMNDLVKKVEKEKDTKLEQCTNKGTPLLDKTLKCCFHEWKKTGETEEAKRPHPPTPQYSSHPLSD